MPDYSPEKLQAFAIRRIQAISYCNDESVGATYSAIFGDDPEAEELGKKLMKKTAVKSKIAELMGRLENYAVANAGSVSLVENNVREFLSQALMAAPDDARMDSPLCDVKVLKDGSKVPVLPDKTGLLNLAARVLKLVGPEVSMQFSPPSWEPSANLGSGVSWRLPEESQAAEISPSAP